MHPNALAALLLVAATILAGCSTQAATLPDHPSSATPASTTSSPTSTAHGHEGSNGHANRTAHPAPDPHSHHAGPTHVGHVFVIVLENEGFNTTFPAADPPSPYLAQNLTAMGSFLTRYYGTGHASLDNYIAMTSGQAPNPLTQGDCAFYADFHEATQTGGQDVGQGCVYPTDATNIADQLRAAGHTWKAYAQSMADNPAAPSSCRHQALNVQDTWQGSTPGDAYATRHEPFVYYHSIIDDAPYCRSHVVDLDNLTTDLATVATTPEFSFITPDVCGDGHDATCTANTTRPGGYDGIDGFLRTWVPRIMNSTAYQQDGLIVINFDEADVSPTGPDAATACCHEQAGYNTAMPGLFGPGGGRTGAILLSPCVKPGTVDATPYNHYSLLRSVEDIFHVGHVGYANDDALQHFALGSCGY